MADEPTTFQLLVQCIKHCDQATASFNSMWHNYSQHKLPRQNYDLMYSCKVTCFFTTF